jgi:F-type H+-transporting ATPase subunit a
VRAPGQAPKRAARSDVTTAMQPESAAHAAETAAGSFNAGEVIIEHIANSPIDHPLISLPVVFGVDFSVTKHLLMLWLVAGLLFAGITWTVRRYLQQDRLVPTGFMNALEVVVEFIRDTVVQPNMGARWAKVYTPLLLTFFLFILTANGIGLVPIFDVASLVNHTVLHLPEESFFARVLHGGVTATGNVNVTAALATVTFFAIIVAGSRAHGFVQHWRNMIPHGLPWPIYFLLIPIEIMGMLVRPFALTMRLAANMTGGHIAILSILSFVFIFTELSGRAPVGIGVGVILSVPLAVGISALEIIVVLVQAYVFTLLSAVFIGMAIHAHH